MIAILWTKPWGVEQRQIIQIVVWRDTLKERRGRRERVERRKLIDGTIKEYRYSLKPKSQTRSKTLSHLVALWQESPEWKKLKKRTQESNTRYLAHLFSDFKSAPFREIKHSHLKTIRNRVSAQRGPGAADGFCNAVGSLFGWALANGHIDINPASKIKGGLERGTLPTWTQEQADLAIAGLPRHYSRAVQFALHTSQRRGDLCAMRWSDYDGTYLTFIQQKTSSKQPEPKPLVMMVSPPLKTLLDLWKSEARGLTILEDAIGQPLKPNTLSIRLPLALQKLGLPKGLNIHGLRKLAAVNMAEQGCTPHEIMSVTGHVTLAMVQLYTKAVNQRRLSEAVVHRLYPNTKIAKTEKT